MKKNFQVLQIVKNYLKKNFQVLQNVKNDEKKPPGSTNCALKVIKMHLFARRRDWAGWDGSFWLSWHWLSIIDHLSLTFQSLKFISMTIILPFELFFRRRCWRSLMWPMCVRQFVTVTNFVTATYLHVQCAPICHGDIFTCTMYYGKCTMYCTCMCTWHGCNRDGWW